MPFSKESASVKHNGGMSKSDIDQGPYADHRSFCYSKRSPEAQGWRPATPPVADMDDIAGDID